MESKLRITPGFCLFGALALLLLPLRWVAGALTAALIHEGFHVLTVWATGGRVLGLTLGSGGARIDTAPMEKGKEALCALAGPLGSFSVLMVAEYFPEAAICGLIQGTYNLLPIFPLDGGRVMRCLLPGAVCTGIEAFSLTMLSGICLAIGCVDQEIGVLVMISLWFPVIQRKISCKEAKLAVQ